MSASGLSILVVDDNEAITAVLETSLNRAGYGVIPAGNGKEALKRYDPNTISLVITDLVMPDMEGIELITALRRLNPKAKIIAMSGDVYSKETGLLCALFLGADCTLKKPFAKEQLIAAVQGLIGGNCADGSSRLTG